MSGARRRHDSVRIAGNARQTARPSLRGGGKARHVERGDANHPDVPQKTALMRVSSWGMAKFNFEIDIITILGLEHLPI